MSVTLNSWLDPSRMSRMTPDNQSSGPGGARPPRLSSEWRIDALTWLRTEIASHENDEELPEDVVRELEEWARDVARGDVLRAAQLHAPALDVTAACLAEASLTPEFLQAVARRRAAARDALMNDAGAGESTSATSPGGVVRELRARRGLSVESTADAFALSATLLLEIESERRPWYELRAECLPRFSALVEESLPRVLALFRVTARRWLVAQVRRRASFALGRFDANPRVSFSHVRERSGVERGDEAGRRTQADLETFRTALAAVQVQNRACAAFFRRAEAAEAKQRQDRPRS